MPAFRTLAIALVLAFLPRLAVDAAAQAWVQKAGGYYFKVSGAYLFSREELNFNGDEQPIFADKFSKTNAWFRDLTFSGYLEYGLTDRLTVVASVPLRVLTSRETENAGPGFPLRRITRTNGGFGDLWLFARTPFMRRPLAIAVQAGVKIPLGYDEAPDNGGPPFGTSDVDGELSLTVGKSLHPIPAYLSAGAGYRVRGGELHDEALYNVEAGYTAGAVFLKIRFDGLQNTHTPPDLGVVTNTSVVGDQDVFKMSSGMTVSLSPRIALSGDIFHMVGGKDTVSGTVYSVGIVVVR